MQKKYTLITLTIIVIIFTFCWSVDAYLSPEEKMNMAFPPSLQVRTSLEHLQSIVPNESPIYKSFISNYESALKLRAPNCMQDISVSRFDSIGAIKKLDVDLDCFHEKDKQLEKLIGTTQISYRLTQAPIRPLAKLGSPSAINIIGKNNYGVMSAASKAGVIIIKRPNNNISLVEVPSGQEVTSLPNMSPRDFSLSPNGRIIAASANKNSIHFWDAETGDELWQTKNVTKLYAWLPEVHAAIVRNTEQPFNIIDFRTGKIKPYSAVSAKSIPWALQISESPVRVLIGDYTNFSLVEYTRTLNEIYGSVVKKFTIESRQGIGRSTPTLMLNGKSIFFATTERNYMSINLETNEEKVFKTHQLLLNRYAKLSEETLLVDSYINAANSRSHFRKPWVFNIKSSTLSPIQTTAGSRGTLLGLNGRVGFIRESRSLWAGDKLEVGKPEILETVTLGHQLEKRLIELKRAEKIATAKSAAKEAAKGIVQLRKNLGDRAALNIDIDQFTKRLLDKQLIELENRSRHRSSGSSNVKTAEFAGSSVTRIAPPSTTSVNFDHASNEKRLQELSVVMDRLIGTLPSNARVEALGVYETKNRSKAGVNVIVKKSDQPLVLILSSSEPVKWNLIKESNSNLIAVIADGIKLPQVTGAGSTRTVILRSNKYHPHTQNDPSYATLNSDSILWTGKPISNFQGEYSGTAFVIGGSND